MIIWVALVVSTPLPVSTYTWLQWRVYAIRPDGDALTLSAFSCFK